MRKFSVAVIFIAGIASPALGQEAAASAPTAPSPDEIKRVSAYYYGGKELGPILVDLKPCTKVDSEKESATKSECLESVSAPVKKNTTIQAWMLWMVPDGGNYDDVRVQFLHNGEVRSTKDVKLTGPAMRSRTWPAITVNKPGKWEIKVMRGDKELGKSEVTVEG